MKYRPEVDGLRAVAVLAVLLFHANIHWLPGGFVGVDIFFVISGYLMLRIILDDVEARRFSVWDFYERRVRRLSPALLFVCFATLPFAWEWMIPREFRNYAQSLFTVPTATSNFLFWGQSGYFEEASALKPLLHTWSLAVEEQFYLLLPLLALAIRRRSRILAAVAAISVLSLLLTQWLAQIDPAGNFFLLPTRFWELGIGGLIAVPMLDRDWARLPAEIASLLGIGAIFGSMVFVDGTFDYPGLATLAPVIGTALVIVFARKTAVGGLLSLKPLVGIGLISYSAYLWHQPLLAFARIRLFGEVPETLAWGLIAATFLLAYLTWRYIERPFRDKTKYSRTQIFTAATVASALLIIFGITADLMGGLLWRNSDRSFAGNINERMRINDGLASHCNGVVPLPEACATSPEPEILLWGDSFAMHLVPGLLASNPHAKFAQFTKSVCPPIFDVAPITMPNYPEAWARGCVAFNEAVRAYIKAHPSIRYALLGSSGFALQNGMAFAGGVPTALNPAETMEQWRATLDWLKANGVTPVIFVPPPRDGSEIGACLVRSNWFGQNSERCDISVAADRSFQGSILDFLDRLRSQYRLIDPHQVLCDAHRCHAQMGNTLIYRDSGHFSVEGSEFIGRELHLYEQISGRLPPD